MSKYKIIMTGGGTAGHVTPNLALAPKLKEKDFEIKYIGSYNGIEKEIITDAAIAGLHTQGRTYMCRPIQYFTM